MYSKVYSKAAHFRLLLGLRLGVRVHWLGATGADVWSVSARCEQRRRRSGGARRWSGWGGELAARLRRRSSLACSSRLLGLHLLLLLALRLCSHAQHRRIDLHTGTIWMYVGDLMVF